MATRWKAADHDPGKCGKIFHDMEKRTRTKYGEVPNCYLDMLTNEGFDTDKLLLVDGDGKRGYWWTVPPPHVRNL